MHDNIIAKLSNEELSENLLNRIQYAQRNLQTSSVKDSSVVQKRFVGNSVPDIASMVNGAFKDSNIVQIDFASHCMAIRVIRGDDGKSINGYRYFDPDTGESPILSAQELNKHVKSTWSRMQHGEVIRVDLVDLEKKVKDLNMISSDGKNIHLLEVALNENNLDNIKKYAKAINIGYREYGVDIFELVITKGTAEGSRMLLENSDSIDYKRYGEKILNTFSRAGKLTEPILDILAKKNVNFDDELKMRIMRGDLEALTFVKHGANLNIDEMLKKKEYMTEAQRNLLQKVECAIKERDTKKTSATWVERVVEKTSLEKMQEQNAKK